MKLASSLALTTLPCLLAQDLTIRGGSVAHSTIGQDFESIINEAISKVYTPTNAGFKLAVHPYVNGEVSYKNPTEDFSFEGTVGRVEVKAVYDRACQASIYKKGTVSDFPGYKHVFPELSWLYSFETNHSIDLPCSTSPMAIKVSSDGSVNGEKFDSSVSLSVDEVAVTSKQYKAEISLEGTSHFSENFPAGIKLEIPESFKFVVKPSAKAACVNPFDNQCTADLDVISTVNDAELAFTKFKWTARSGVFQVRSDQQPVFRLKINYGKYWKISYMCKESVCGQCPHLQYYTSNKMSHLITVPSVEALPEIFEAYDEFFGLFLMIHDNLSESMKTDYKTVAKFFVYFDKFVAVLINDEDAFDCSGLVSATGFEWPWLASKWGVESVQTHAMQVCSEIVNPKIESFLGAIVAPEVLAGREYARDILSTDSEAEFGVWTSEIFAFQNY